MQRLGILGLLVFLTGCTFNVRTTPRYEMRVGDATYRVEIAKTADQQRQGLSGRQHMENDEGMLFPYSPPATPSFWMKDMRFAIDIIWVADERVVGIEQGVPADDGARFHPAPQPIDAVLELNAGTAARGGIAVGDAVNYPPDAWN